MSKIGIVNTETGGLGQIESSEVVYVAPAPDKWIDGDPSTGLEASEKLLEKSRSTIGCSINSGTVIVIGEKTPVVVPYPCKVEGWTLVGSSVGDIEFDVWKDHEQKPVLVSQSICPSGKPALVGAVYAASDDVSSWVTDLVAGDVLLFVVNSVTGLTGVTLTLKVRR